MVCHRKVDFIVGYMFNYYWSSPMYSFGDGIRTHAMHVSYNLLAAAICIIWLSRKIMLICKNKWKTYDLLIGCFNVSSNWPQTYMIALLLWQIYITSKFRRLSYNPADYVCYETPLYYLWPSNCLLKCTIRTTAIVLVLPYAHHVTLITNPLILSR